MGHSIRLKVLGYVIALLFQSEDDIGMKESRLDFFFFFIIFISQ